MTSPRPPAPPSDPHRFRLKGQNAESFLHALAKKSFLIDWCFPNPRLPDGKELCDLLVVFDHTAIIWQAKDLKLNRHGKYKASEVRKNLSQVSGAHRQLLELKSPIDLENARRGKERFDPSAINEVFLISALLGEGEDAFPMTEETKTHIVHVFTREFSEIALNELDTISDFLAYLRAKEGLLAASTASMFVMGGEQTLLAYYLLNDRSFDRIKDFHSVALEDGLWAELQTDARYLAKKQADRVSYAWDSDIIGRVHEGSSRYEIVARELARPNRFERRALAENFLGAHTVAHNDTVHQILRRVTVSKTATREKETTYCFLFMDASIPEDERRKMLECFCLVARQRFPKNSRVMGIATEKEFASSCSYDYILLDVPTWTAEHEQLATLYAGQLGILRDPVVSETSGVEYPDPAAGPPQLPGAEGN